MTAERFLIIQLYSNGDCLYVTTLARQLKNDHPRCHITWAIAPFCAAILQHNPYVDTIWPVEYMNDRKIETFRNNRRRLFEEAGEKGFDKIFFTQIIEENFVHYDGLVRSSLFSAFGLPIIVPLTPIISLSEQEKEKVAQFAENNHLGKFRQVILFECAPQSGQLAMDINRARALAASITERNEDCCVILSSANKVEHPSPQIVDGSVLSLRETAALTHYCHLLIGCSSGITWSATSEAAKQLPSIQLLNKRAYIFNSPVLDHNRMHLSTDRWLELYKFDDSLVGEAIEAIFRDGFDKARIKYGQHCRQTFRLYRGITHSFIQYRQLGLLFRFIRRNIKVHGYRFTMLKSIFLGIVLFPLQYFLNKRKA